MSYPPPPPPQQPGYPQYGQQPPQQQSVTYYRRRTNHTFHLLMCYFTCFLWVPVWLCVTMWNAWGPRATAHTNHR